MSYQLLNHAGEVPFSEWKANGIEIPIFDKDNTLTSFHDDALLDEVAGPLREGLQGVYENIALVSNSHDAEHVQEVGETLSEALGVNVFSISKADGYKRKPSPEMGIVVAKHFGIQREQLGVIGDRRFVDVRFGINLGAGAIALCRKVGFGDAKGVPLIRAVESLVVSREQRTKNS
jgi:HAD superfamily hydrolase (TIGR01662 family)